MSTLLKFLHTPITLLTLIIRIVGMSWSICGGSWSVVISGTRVIMTPFIDCSPNRGRFTLHKACYKTTSGRLFVAMRSFYNIKTFGTNRETAICTVRLN